jgi:hypothetical protein
MLLCLTNLTATAQTQVNAGAVNGVLNPTFFSGSDIGAKVNTAFSSGIGKTVRIPVGTYSFSTTMGIPAAGYELLCDAGAVLNYTGSGDAITLPSTTTGTADTGVDGQGGCHLTGTASAKSGVHLFPSNHTFVRNLEITGFSNGYGIYNTGANAVEISANNIRLNLTGIYLTGVTTALGNYAANAVHISNNEIVNNSEWGIDSENSHCFCSWNLGNLIIGNTIENNANGVELNWEVGTTVEANYFENAGVNLGIGNGLDNVYGVNVLHNYFTGDSGNPESISLGYGIGFDFEDNSVLGSTELVYPSNNKTTACFINKTYGPNGSDANIRGIGTNYLVSSAAAEICNHNVPGN